MFGLIARSIVPPADDTPGPGGAPKGVARLPRPRAVYDALYQLYEQSGFTMAGAVAFSVVVSIFPFCIFLGALAGVFGGRELAQLAIDQLFEILPNRVAQGLAPDIEAVMGRTRIDLLGASGFIALFFATNAIETMRAALNSAYRVNETRSYPLCLAISALFVLISAVCMLILTWMLVVAPAIAARFEPEWLKRVHDATWFTLVTRYASAAAVMAVMLFAFHIWLAAGRRTVGEVWPGVLLSIVLWLLVAGIYSWYLDLNDYTRFYAGLSQIMVALIFFQVTGIIILLGAELNRGVLELRRLAGNGELGGG
jgi:membrane protein